jgi:hypothetical protein
VLEGDIGIASPTLSGRLRSLLEKGPSLPAWSPVPRIHHLRRTMGPGSIEETVYLLHSSAKDQKGGVKILGSSKILSPLDTWIFKPGQTTLRRHTSSGMDPLN